MNVIEIKDTRITDERLVSMDIMPYLDSHSAIVGFGVEDSKRLFVFYCDGYCQVVELTSVGLAKWMSILNAAQEGYGLEYLASKYVTWVTEDENLRAIAYLDYRTNARCFK